MKNKYTAAVFFSGVISGFTGIFRRTVAAHGVDSFGFVLIRSSIGTLFFALVILLSNPHDFKIKPKDFWCFIGAGLLSFTGFNLCYFQAMTLMSLSAAAVLLYSAPIFVILFSALLFHEAITPRKLIAVGLAFLGCALSSGIISRSIRPSLPGILFGLGSGLGYALFSVFSTIAMRRGYRSITVNFWSCLLATASMILIKAYQTPLAAIPHEKTIGFLYVAVGFVTCFLPYMLYTYGLSGLEPGIASVIVSIEPVVATAVGVLIYKEALDLWIVLGMILVPTAIAVLNRKQKTKVDLPAAAQRQARKEE